MKFLRVCILFFAIVRLSVAQSDEQEIKFIEKLIRENQPEGQIIYAEKINKDDLKKIKDKIRVQSIYDRSKTVNQNYINLTTKEKKYILHHLEDCCFPTWKEDLFPNSKIFKSEDAVAYIKKTYSEYLEKYNNPNNTEEDRMNMVKSYQRPNIFKFSKPVYLRENTLFFFYFSSTCGDPCGFEEIAFYRKENNNWVRWILVERKDF